MRLRQFIIDFSHNLARENKNKFTELNSRLVALEQRVHRGENLSALLEEARTELDEYLSQQAQGAMLWAQVREATEGERSTAYFLRQERVRGQQKLINAIRRSDGTVVSSTSDVLGVWRDFYFRLFSSQELSEVDQRPFLDSIERRLTSNESKLCEGDLTIEECSKALSNMPVAKSPGVDSLPAEFYRRFWTLLGPDLVEVYNFCYRHGRLCKSQRQGAITLLYKKGDCLDPANWRPITLLCVDYKIAAKALGNCLLQVITSVVSADQSCGIPGRSPAANVLLDVACYADQNNIGGAIVSLDQEKAFDRVEISFLMKVLERMGFGPSFRNWIGLLYTDVHSAVSVNGFLTEFFPVTRGVRQGCPLSPLLYVLVMESLASVVRADIHIDGFPCYHPWKCFFRHFLRRAFLSEPVERVFRFTSIGSSTLRRLPVFYHQVLDAWLRLDNWDNLEHLTSKIAYRRIQPEVTHRCMTKFADYHLDWSALWCDLELYFVDKPIWKTNFLLLHGILPTVDRLAHWGIEPRNTLCHCGQPESQEHLFEDCSLTLILVNWFEELLGRKWPDYRLSNAHIQFGHPASAGFPAGFKFLLATLRHYVWVARNSWQFEGTRPDPQLLVEKIESSFRFVSKVTRKNGSLGECCSLCRRSLVPLVPASALGGLGTDHAI